MSKDCLKKILSITGENFNTFNDRVDGDSDKIANDVCNFVSNGGKFNFSYQGINNYINLANKPFIPFVLMYDNKKYGIAYINKLYFIDKYTFGNTLNKLMEKIPKEANEDLLKEIVSKKSNIDKIKSLALFTNVNYRNSVGATALLNAIKVKFLLEKGADVNLSNGLMTPLMLASLYYHNNSHEELDIIKLLLEYGARINDVNSDGMTALLYSLETSINMFIPELLIKSGADISVKYKYGKTILMRAAEIEYTHIIRQRSECQ